MEWRIVLFKFGIIVSVFNSMLLGQIASMPDTVAFLDGSVSIPVMITDVVALEGLELTVQYDETVLMATSISFENTELEKSAKIKSADVFDIYLKTLAGKFALEKELIAYELRKYGIQSILTTSKKLSVDTINKYLEIKSRGMI